MKVAEPEQLGFSLAGMQAAPLQVSPHAVRLELNALLETAKSARDCPPWDSETHRKHRTMFVEKSKILPPDEAEFLRRQFVLELDRIELLLAA
jgi:hypothetical protein